MKRDRRSGRRIDPTEARAEGLHAARRNDATRQKDHPLTEGFDPPAPRWARWRVDHWDPHISNWRLWGFARDDAQRRRLADEIRALGHRLRYKELRTPSSPKPPTSTRPRGSELDQLRWLATRLCAPVVPGRAPLLDESSMCELGAALSRLLRLPSARDPEDWRCTGAELVARRQVTVGQMLAKVTAARRVPILSPELRECIRRLR